MCEEYELRAIDRLADDLADDEWLALNQMGPPIITREQRIIHEARQWVRERLGEKDPVTELTYMIGYLAGYARQLEDKL